LRVRSLGSAFATCATVALVAAFALALPAAPAFGAAAQTGIGACGPEHEREVREILKLRNPGARETVGGALWLDRALIVDDFLRLIAAHRAARVASPAPEIDDALLRRQRDTGLTTPEVCAVVRFMYAYYTSRAAASARAQVAAKPAAEPAEVETEELPEVPPERPVRARVAEPQPAPAPEPVPAPVPSPVAEVTPAPRAEPAPPSAASAPAPSPEPAPAPVEIAAPAVPQARPPHPPLDVAEAPAARPEPPAALQEPEIPPAVPQRRPALHAALLAPAKPQGLDAPTRKEAETLRQERARADAQIGAALPWITEFEDQLAVPRYLSFRETRVETPELAEEELRLRREASLRAMDRVVVLLSLMKDDVELRRAVHVTLGAQGRARLERSLLLTVQSVPDASQGAWALRLWRNLELEAGRD
jgi:hypothetical protein